MAPPVGAVRVPRAAALGRSYVRKPLFSREGANIELVEGAVADAFIRDRSTIAAIMGPVGSGKTTGSLIRLVATAAEQPRSPVDGKRRAKFAIVRDTYPNLRKTVLASWFNLFPPSMGRFSGEAPITHELTIALADGSILELTVEFIALGEHRVEDVMRGWEGTGAYLNEADLLSQDVLTYVHSRTGRYPSKLHGGCAWKGVILDFNAPDTDNWVYPLLVEAPVEGARFFRQPSGFSARAENLANLDGAEGYYRHLAIGKPDWWVRRFIRNEWGFSREGKPVWHEFVDARHVAAAPLLPDKRLPLLLSADAGRTPALLIGQHDERLGQVRILDEVVAVDMGGRPFGELVARVLAAPPYAGMTIADGWCDPSADSPGQNDDADWIDSFYAGSKIRLRGAPTNNLHPRLEAVRLPLLRTVDGDRPGLLISPTCKTLRKALGLAGVLLGALALILGAGGVPIERSESSAIYLGLDWFVLGTLTTAALLVPLERWRPVEPVTDRRAVATDVLYTLIHRLGLFRLVFFFTLEPWVLDLTSWYSLSGGPTWQLDAIWPGVTDRASSGAARRNL